MPARVRIAHVRRAHGLKGELLVRPLTENPGDAFTPGRSLYTGLDEDATLVRLRGARAAGDGWLLAVEGVADRTAAEAWRGRDLWVAREEYDALGDSTPPLDDLVGLSIQLADGTRVGTVTNYYDLPQGPMLEVDRGEDQVLFPLHPDFVRRLDPAAGVLIVDPPAGLFD